MGHDQRFKEFLQTFLQEFLRLFFPDVERRLDFGTLEFLDKEVFTDLGEGSSRHADVVARLETVDGEPELLLVHIEVQARPEKDFASRMFAYYALLRARYGLPVFPVVVYLRGGAKGLTAETFREHLFGDEILTFRYRAVELARLNVEEYRTGVGPVGAALGGLMDTSRARERAELRAALMLEVVDSGLDDARQLLLANLIATYLELSAEEWKRYRKLTSRKEFEKVQEVDETWMDKLLRQGKEQGLEEGLVRGKEQGLLEGKEQGLLEGKLQTLLMLMQRKFGPLPLEVEQRIREIDRASDLDRLVDRILTAKTLEEMKLDA